MTGAGFADGQALSCSTCGARYDPEFGDPAREVPSGTPFGSLPDYWRCPGCGGPQHGFAAPPGDGDPIAVRVAALVDAYGAIAARDMADVPICNPALRVEAVGFQDIGTGWLGIVVTPWFLNAVLLPRDPAEWADQRDGDTSVEILPTGQYTFTAARLGALGTLKMIPVVSAMNVFADQEEARAAARLALARLTARAEPPPPPAAEPPRPAPAGKPALSRRALFGGRRS